MIVKTTGCVYGTVRTLKGDVAIRVPHNFAWQAEAKADAVLLSHGASSWTLTFRDWLRAIACGDISPQE